MTPGRLMAAGLLVALLANPAVAGARARKARMTKASTTAPAHPAAAARTLDDIHIEGEIPVPQVLFITARDQRRFLEFQNRRYLRTSRKIGEDTVLPSKIVVTGARPTPDQEISR